MGETADRRPPLRTVALAPVVLLTKTLWVSSHGAVMTRVVGSGI
jgi:hypothetical protein